MAAAKKLAVVLVVALSVLGAAYVAVGSRQENLQPKVHIGVSNGHFWELASTCPNQLAQVPDSKDADYSLTVVWGHLHTGQKEGWFYELLRRDGASLGPDLEAANSVDPNALRVARKVCADIRRDFTLWLNTQRVKTSIGKSIQTGGTTTAEDFDPPRRYEMTEYHNGPIVGIALLDTKLGRTWLLTNITDSSGKTIRTKFNEASVEDLWQSSDELYDSHFKWPQDHINKVSHVKDFTRPIAIQRAEDQALKSP